MTKLIATYDFLYGPAHDREIIRRGDEFEPHGTGTMSREEHAKSMIRQGAAMRPEDWAKRKPQADANWAAATRERDSLTATHAAAKAARDAKLKAEEEARAAAWRG